MNEQDWEREGMPPRDVVGVVVVVAYSHSQQHPFPA